MSSKDDTTDTGTADVDRPVPVRKREFLAAAFGVGLAAIAGCTGGGSRNGDGSGDGADGSGGTGDGGDGGDDPNDGNDDGGQSSGNPDLPDIAEPESYVMEMRFNDDDSTEDSGPTVYEVHGDDLIFYQEGSKDEQASYIVDGDLYQVLGDQCMKMDEDDPGNPRSEAPEYEPAESYSYERVGTETVDGVELEVYRQEGTAEYRIYIDPETNYVRRLESGEGGTTTVFHSFDEVDPIEPPDMECQDVSGGGTTVESPSG